MITSCEESRRDEAVSPWFTRDGGWRKAVQSRAEIAQAIENLTSAMAAAGYPEADVFGVRLALEEAITNAVKHGHRGDSTIPVLISYHVNVERVLAQVEDQGEGFDPRQVPDPLAPENLERVGGRGLFLMRSFTTWMGYNQRGNRVTLCKCHSEHVNVGSQGPHLRLASP
jgi:serine/threonine-protein kinase RsbW